ncbi:transposase, partial [Campylobacter sp. RM9328]|uniref:transposase n=1 Tax=Campylobacter sp. RM9328 TaxID=1705720 RepID=UPI0014751098
ALTLLTKLQTQLKNFNHSQSNLQDKILSTFITNLTTQIKQTHSELKLLAYDLLKNIIPQTEKIIKENKGIGIDLALNLFPQLHFNRDKSEKQIVSFIGLSPRVFQSGSSVNKTLCINKHGSPLIRKSLFTCALVCIRFNDKFRIRYENLISRGKNKKLAIVAVMCAIVRYLKSFFKF